MIEYSICSYSFHRLLAAGKQDIFQYIEDCRALGCAYLDPWNAHLSIESEGTNVLHAGSNPGAAQLSAVDEVYLARIKKTAEETGIPFGCIAVDGAHIYEADPAARKKNREKAYRWLEIAETLGARQVRIDCGGPAEMPDDVFAIIKEGYRDLIERARAKGLQVLIENHWGPSLIPANLVKLLAENEGLGLLFDTNNWAPGLQEKGWEMCAKYADITHIKTFMFDRDGNDSTVDIPRVMNMLCDSGYKGVWGIESCPKDGDEYAGARKSIALIERVLAGRN